MLATEAETDLFDGLKALEQRVDQMDAALRALNEDPRWEQTEGRLNFLSDQMRQYAVKAGHEDVEVGSPQWSPIDLTPEEPKP